MKTALGDAGKMVKDAQTALDRIRRDIATLKSREAKAVERLARAKLWQAEEGAK